MTTKEENEPKAVLDRVPAKLKQAVLECGYGETVLVLRVALEDGSPVYVLVTERKR